MWKWNKHLNMESEGITKLAVRNKNVRFKSPAGGLWTGKQQQ